MHRFDGDAASRRSRRAATIVSAVVISGLALSGAPAASAAEAGDSAGQVAAAPTETTAATITVDGSSEGRIFDGIGAISGGGATSRLLLDYPEQERDEVLDYLFTPGYGASLQLLKVEIGGDTNTTDGSESSHAHVRGEVNCDAGYEWWLMQEAVERNPDITLGALAWGAPGWLGDGEYFSHDTIEYFIDWLDCAKGHGLTIDNMGVRNEREYESAWVKEYRAALDAAGYEDVRIIASDEAARKGEWPIAVDMANDAELFDAVDLLGNHYSTGPSSATAQSLGKPLWISEGGPWSAEWGAGGSAKSIPSLLNHAYIQGRITGVEIWNLLTAYYDGLSISDAGLMRANTPWSGDYQVQSAIWAVAHTTQFTEPGWQYLDEASGYFDASSPTQGSFVTLKSPSGGDWSTVIENIGTSEPRDVTLSVSDDLRSGDLHVWQTTADDWFSPQADLAPAADGTYTVTVPANSAVTVTTTTGQGHGDAVGQPQSAFPFPYRDSLADGGASGQTRYFSQMEGAYEERACEGGRDGTCLTQVSMQPAISWAAWKKPAGILGDLDWSDYRATVQAFVPDGGTAQVLGRVSNDAMQPVPNGYGLSLASDGTWSLSRGVPGGRSSLELATGKLDGSGAGWHELSLTFDDDAIAGEIDGRQVTEVTDATWISGMVGLSGDYSATQFADLAVEPLDPILAIDDAATAIRYDGGWQHCSARAGRHDGCSGFTVPQVDGAGDGTITGSNRAGDSLTVDFDGTQATLVGIAGPRGGAATASIDGNEPVALSFQKQGRGGEVVWRTPVLIDGPHTLRIEVISDDPGNRGWVGLDRVEVVQARGGASSVDDQSEGSGGGRLDYRGSGWLSCPGCINRTGLYHSSVTSTAVAGDSVDFRFSGSSVELYGLRASNQGIATVLIDGVQVGTADFYGKVRVGNQLIWTSPALAPGEHVLSLVAIGSGNEQASGADINVDRLLVRP
jgi:O-glycosyl hydrolase